MDKQRTAEEKPALRGKARREASYSALLSHDVKEAKGSVVQWRFQSPRPQSDAEDQFLRSALGERRWSRR